MVKCFTVSLTPHQTNHVWEEKVEAEVRSLYFGELASSLTHRKQLMAGATFFLSSGAAATVIAKLPALVPAALALCSAIAAAYSMASELDKCIATLVDLHRQWNQLSMDYDSLWNHWYEEDAEERLRELSRRANEASGLGVKMPFDEKAVNKWMERVYARVRQVPAQ
jgi:hypothetical protein